MSSVLFVRLSAMGDLVHGLGAIEALHRVRPDWDLSLVTQPESIPLLEAWSWPLRVIPFARRAGVGAVFDLRRRLRQHHFDVALDLQGNWKSALVARLSGAARTLGMRGGWRRESTSRLLLDETIDRPGSPHPARAAWHLVRELAPEAQFLLPSLVAREDEVRGERAALRAIGLDVDAPFAVIVVTDVTDPRALRPEVVARLAARRAGRVLLLAGPDESGVATPEGVPILRHARGELRRLVALGALVASVGGTVFGPDQGATHVLSAAGASTRVAFGSQDPARTAPPGAVAVVHEAPPPCRPCRSRRCHLRGGPVCMDFDPESGRVVEGGGTGPG